MRIVYICLLLIFAGTELSFGQIGKGTQYLGVELSASTRKISESPSVKVRETGFNITPSYSYFISDGWELRGGLGVGAGSRRSKGTDLDVEQSSYSLVPSISFRKHLMVSEKLGFATGPYAAYALNKIKYEREDDLTYTQYRAGIDLQIEYFPMKQFGLAANLFDVSYSKMDVKEGGKSYQKTSQINAGLSNQVSLRFFYIFGKD